MAKVRIDRGMALFYCEGCKRPHMLNVSVEGSPKWTYNGNELSPTFTPSVLARYTHPKGFTNDNPAPLDFDGEYVTDVCHSFVTDGCIQYLSDSTHELSGQTIELPEFKWGENDD